MDNIKTKNTYLHLKKSLKENKKDKEVLRLECMYNGCTKKPKKWI